MVVLGWMLNTWIRAHTIELRWISNVTFNKSEHESRDLHVFLWQLLCPSFWLLPTCLSPVSGQLASDISSPLIRLSIRLFGSDHVYKWRCTCMFISDTSPSWMPPKRRKTQKHAVPYFKTNGFKNTCPRAVLYSFLVFESMLWSAVGSLQSTDWKNKQTYSILWACTRGDGRNNKWCNTCLNTLVHLKFSSLSLDSEMPTETTVVHLHAHRLPGKSKKYNSVMFLLLYLGLLATGIVFKAIDCIYYSTEPRRH